MSWATWLFSLVMVLGVFSQCRADRVQAQGKEGGDSRGSIDFEMEISPLLSRFGCNASACHGKAEGQNGFKLSIFGYDPLADYHAITQESRGRRVSVAIPERSLFLLKASGETPHGGGPRILKDSEAYETLRRWISEGIPFKTSAQRIAAIEVLPRRSILQPGASQPLKVLAVDSTGGRKDVTHLAQFQTNEEVLARVDEFGVVRIGDRPGQAAVMARYLGFVDTCRILVPREGPGAGERNWPEANFIDVLVHRQLRQLNIAPSESIGDAAFLRRVYLDIIGTLPTAAEARAFLRDRSEKAREKLVDRLLERPEYADYWALKWADLLRVDRQVLEQKEAYGFYRWIRTQLARNKPMDQWVKELLTAEGPISEAPQGNFYKVVNRPGDMASTVSQVFLGVRIACAECHHHPFDRWGQTDYYGMQAFFQQVNRVKTPGGELLLAEGSPETVHPKTKQKIQPHALGMPMPMETPLGDRRQRLAEWLVSPENAWFARNAANRLTAHFLGRGLVEPVDDARATNPPTNPELLDALGEYFAREGFDLKQLIRTLVMSATYQRSSAPNETNFQDEQNYSRALMKRLPAEVLMDAVCQATGVEEKFNGLPGGYRAIQLWDSQVPHYFLKLFGRPSRGTACDCERNAEASVSQVLHLMNSPEILGKIGHEGGRVARLWMDQRSVPEKVEELYLGFFSRFPTEEERRRAAEYIGRRGDGREALEDLAWTMLNSLEFIFNH